MRSSTATACLFLAAMTPSLAFGNQPLLWKDVGQWTVRVTNDAKPACFASVFWQDGTKVTLGFDKGKRTPSMVVENPDWVAVPQNDGYDLVVQFGSQTPWRVPSEISTRREDNLASLRIEARDLLFFEEMMGVSNLNVRFGSDNVDHFDMSDGYEVFAELDLCQNTMSGLARQVAENE